MLAGFGLERIVITLLVSIPIGVLLGFLLDGLAKVNTLTAMFDGPSSTENIHNIDVARKDSCGSYTVFLRGVKTGLKFSDLHSHLFRQMLLSCVKQN